MWHTQKCTTGTQTFPISKLGGWKYITEFHKSSKTNRHQAFKYIPILMLWKSIENCQQKRAVELRIGVTLACLQQAGKLPRRTSHRNTTQKRGTITSAVLKKFRKHTQWVSAIIRVKSNKRRLASLDLKAKVVKLGDGWQVSGRSTDTLKCLLSKWSDSRSVLPTDSHTSPPPPLTSGGIDELEPNTANLRVDHHLWGDWTFIIIFISSHLTADKLFTVNTRAITGSTKDEPPAWG